MSLRDTHADRAHANECLLPLLTSTHALLRAPEIQKAMRTGAIARFWRAGT